MTDLELYERMAKDIDAYRKRLEEEKRRSAILEQYATNSRCTKCGLTWDDESTQGVAMCPRCERDNVARDRDDYHARYDAALKKISSLETGTEVANLRTALANVNAANAALRDREPPHDYGLIVAERDRLQERVAELEADHHTGECQKCDDLAERCVASELRVAKLETQLLRSSDVLAEAADKISRHDKRAKELEAEVAAAKKSWSDCTMQLGAESIRALKAEAELAAIKRGPCLIYPEPNSQEKPESSPAIPICSSCDEHHPPECDCPPHEVRTRGHDKCVICHPKKPEGSPPAKRCECGGEYQPVRKNSFPVPIAYCSKCRKQGPPWSMITGEYQAEPPAESGRHVGGTPRCAIVHDEQGMHELDSGEPITPPPAKSVPPCHCHEVAINSILRRLETLEHKPAAPVPEAVTAFLDYCSAKPESHLSESMRAIRAICRCLTAAGLWREEER